MISDALFQYIYYDLKKDISKFRLKTSIKHIETRTGLPSIKKVEIGKVLKRWRSDSWNAVTNPQQMIVNPKKNWDVFLGWLNDPNTDPKLFILCSKTRRFAGEYFQPSVFEEFKDYMIECKEILIKAEQSVGDTMRSYEAELDKSGSGIMMSSRMLDDLALMPDSEKEKFFLETVKIDVFQEFMLDNVDFFKKALVEHLKSNQTKYLILKDEVEKP